MTIRRILFVPPLLLLLQPPAVESRFEQVAPVPTAGKAVARTPGQRRAVVLIHGLHLHPFNEENVARPLMRDWQRPGSKLVRKLARHADVFAFAYAQDVAVEEVAANGGLRKYVRALRAAGYREVILVGHSAGGIVAREFVEDNPKSGVTKVIQVCAPNGGSSWAKIKAAREDQHVFLDSLTKEARRKRLKARKGKRIPAGVQFVCVVGTGADDGDGVVRADCQWTPDLQRQGIPAVKLRTFHPLAPRGSRGANTIAALVRSNCPRWTPRQTTAAREEILDD